MIYIILDNKVVSHSSGKPREFPGTRTARCFCRNHWIEVNNEVRSECGLSGTVEFVSSVPEGLKRHRVNDDDKRRVRNI